MTEKTTTDDAPFNQRPLYKFLMDRFPKCRTVQGLFDVPGFAKALGMSHEGVYKWLRADKIGSPAGAMKVVDLSIGEDHPIKPKDIFQFVIR